MGGSIICDVCGISFTAESAGQRPKRCSAECRKEAIRRYEGVNKCIVPKCERTTRRKNYCDKHYGQMRKWGEIRESKEYEKCTAPECERKPRSKQSPYCEMHYYRLRRNGTLETVAPRVPDSACIAPECTELAFHTTGECRNHYLGRQRNGDYAKRTGGEMHYNWLDVDEVNYCVVHQRLKKTKGSARGYKCESCGKQAKHWAYNHSSPDERMEEVSGYILPFSPNLEDYIPMCVPCHKALDLSASKSRRND